MKKYWQSAGLYLLIFVIILGALAFSGKGLMQQQQDVKVYVYSDLLRELENDTVKAIEVTTNTGSGDVTALAVLDDGTTIQTTVPSITALMEKLNTMPAEGSDIQIITDSKKESMLFPSFSERTTQESVAKLELTVIVFSPK